MKRVLVDYSKLTKNILNLLIDKFPEGYDYSDVISFKNAKGELIESIEVRTDDTIYLVKISSKLEQSMEDHENDDEDAEDDDLGIDELEPTENEMNA